MSRRRAIDIAMEASAYPGVASLLSVGPLPDDLKALLRIVADGEWRHPSTEHAYRLHDAEKVRTASANFLSGVLFSRKHSDPYRVLGLQPGATLGEVREHKRLLLKWLHPDRNPRPEEQEYLSRVIEASGAIESGRVDIARTTPATPGPQARSGRQAKPRGAATRSAPSLTLLRQLCQGAAGPVSRMLRTAKVLALTVAIIIASLVTWRYVMDEPIGTSVERYSRIAMGLLAWR